MKVDRGREIGSELPHHGNQRACLVVMTRLGAYTSRGLPLTMIEVCTVLVLLYRLYSFYAKTWDSGPESQFCMYSFIICLLPFIRLSFCGVLRWLAGPKLFSEKISIGSLYTNHFLRVVQKNTKGQEHSRRRLTLSIVSHKLLVSIFIVPSFCSTGIFRRSKADWTPHAPSTWKSL